MRRVLVSSVSSVLMLCLGLTAGIPAQAADLGGPDATVHLSTVGPVLDPGPVPIPIPIPNPELIARRCKAAIAAVAQNCTTQIKRICSYCVGLVKRLLDAGYFHRAVYIAKTCIRVIDNIADQCVAKILQICHKCIGILLHLNRPDLAEDVKHTCGRAINHVRDIQQTCHEEIRGLFSDHPNSLSANF